MDYYDDMIPRSSFTGIIIEHNVYRIGSSSRDHIIYKILNLDDEKVETAEEFAIQLQTEGDIL